MKFFQKLFLNRYFSFTISFYCLGFLHDMIIKFFPSQLYANYCVLLPESKTGLPLCVVCIASLFPRKFFVLIAATFSLQFILVGPTVSMIRPQANKQPILKLILLVTASKDVSVTLSELGVLCGLYT